MPWLLDADVGAMTCGHDVRDPSSYNSVERAPANAAAVVLRVSASHTDAIAR